MGLLYFSVFVKVCFITLHVVHFWKASIDGLLSRLCILWGLGGHIFMFIWSKMSFNSVVYFILFHFLRHSLFWTHTRSPLVWETSVNLLVSFSTLFSVCFLSIVSCHFFQQQIMAFYSLFPSSVAVTASYFATHPMSQMPHVSRFSGRIQLHSLEGSHLLFCIIRWMGPIKHLEVPGQPGLAKSSGAACKWQKW